MAFGIAALWLVMMPGLLLSVWLTADNDYTEVRPASSAGCRAWVEESSFIKISNGTVYAAGPWQPLALPTNSYAVDDAFRPVKNGQYSVSWSEEGRSVSVHVWGTESDPVVGTKDGPGNFCW